MSGQNRDIEKKRLAELAREAQGGDASAFKKIITSLQPELIRYGFFLSRDPQQAEDLAQDTLFRAYESLSTLKEPENLKAWMYRILKNLFLNQIQTAGAQREVVTEEMEEMVDPEVSQPEMEKALSLRKLLQTLNPVDRLLMLMVHLQGFSYQEAAQATDLTEDAVRLRLHRARMELSKKMEEP